MNSVARTPKFYSYRQNNSGGVYELPAVTVVIQAKSIDHADERVQEIGVYFDGCSTGRDCSCCGDRWFGAWSDEGDDVPSEYSEPILDKDGGDYILTENEFNDAILVDGRIPKIMIYYMDGTQEYARAKQYIGG